MSIYWTSNNGIITINLQINKVLVILLSQAYYRRKQPARLFSVCSRVFSL